MIRVSFDLSFYMKIYTALFIMILMWRLGEQESAPVTFFTFGSSN